MFYSLKSLLVIMWIDIRECAKRAVGGMEGYLVLSCKDVEQ
jgi:hypothetical protein